MALTLILICLAIQRGLRFDSYTRQYDWFTPYYRWFKHRFADRPYWSGMGGAFLIILPALIIYILVALLVCSLIGLIAYALLTLLVLWYCLDARPLAQEDVDHATTGQALEIVYQRLFAVIFWLLILGSTGVVLYTLVVSLCRIDEGEETKPLHQAAFKIQGVLDWVPLRLIGITYALVGHFAPAFQCWYENLWTGIEQGRERVANCALIALGFGESSSLSEERLQDINRLVNRALLVWLVVIALFTIGAWIG